MFPYYLLPGNKPKPKPKPKPRKPSSYLPSYLTVYVKPDPPPARDTVPNDIIGFVQPPPPPPPAQETIPNDIVAFVQPTPPSSTSTYDPRPDSQRPGGKPAKKTIIPLPRPNVQIPLVAFTSGDVHKARDIENRYQDLIEDHLLPDDMDYQEAQAAFERADVQRLSDEQKLRIDYLLGTEDDPLTRSMLLAVKHEGIPGHLSFEEYMARFADWGLVEESDRRAWQVMQSNIKDLTNDRYESARAIDLNSGDEVFLRAGSRHSVLLQDEHKRMLEGRDIALIHNHPNNSPASNADLEAALDLGVLFLVLVTPSGLQYHYRRYGEEMKLVEVIHNRDYVALPSAGEDAESRAAYEAQLLAEAGNPAEIVMRQGDDPPSPRDYIFHENTRHKSEPDIKQDYARYDPWLRFLKLLNPEVSLSDTIIFTAVHKFAESAKDSGYDMAGELLQHNLGSSGKSFRIPVDEMIAELPGFRESIMNYVDIQLDNYFLSSNAEESALSGGVVEQVGEHTIYSFSLPWKEVGIGGNAEENIYDFDDDDLPANYGTIHALATGQPPLDHIPQEQYDWFLAVNKIHYYPRIAVVVDNTTGIAEVGLVIEVRDHYAWYVNKDTGLLNSTMASMERIGLGRNFPVFGRSSLMTGTYNLNEGKMKSGDAHHQLTIDGWDNDE